MCACFCSKMCVVLLYICVSLWCLKQTHLTEPLSSMYRYFRHDLPDLPNASMRWSGLFRLSLRAAILFNEGWYFVCYYYESCFIYGRILQRSIWYINSKPEILQVNFSSELHPRLCVCHFAFDYLC